MLPCNIHRYKLCGVRCGVLVRPFFADTDTICRLPRINNIPAPSISTQPPTSSIAIYSSVPFYRFALFSPIATYFSPSLLSPSLFPPPFPLSSSHCFVFVSPLLSLHSLVLLLHVYTGLVMCFVILLIDVMLSIALSVSCLVLGNTHITAMVM